MNNIRGFDRAEFITKTFTCVFLQFLFTFSCIALCVFNQTLYMFVLRNVMRFILIGIIGTLATIYYMIYAQKKTGIQLAIFTIFETLSVCAVSVLYGPNTILMAMLVTIGLTAGLGVYALTTNNDHIIWFDLFSSGLSCLLVIGLMNLFINSPILHMIELYTGTIIFLGYIILDIQLFLNKSTNSYVMNHISQYGINDLHIIASLNIYLDVINLFIRMLEIISKMKGNNTTRYKKRNL